MRVLKFGGSSVGHPDRIKAIAKILTEKHELGGVFCVVVSAFGGATDQLIEMARLAERGETSWREEYQKFRTRHEAAIIELTSGDRRVQLQEDITAHNDALSSLLEGISMVREASPRTMDYVLSFGERNSAFIISRALQEVGLNAQFLDARNVIKTDKRFGAANVNFKATYESIDQHFRTTGGIQVVTGFIASSAKGLTTTLGRGGSDYTAALIAAGVKAEAIEIWTDVDGVMTADPRAVRRAFTIPHLSYPEAMEMSHFGAKVIYPPTLLPAMQLGIPLYIKNTFRPEFEGSLVTRSADPTGRAVKGISSLNDIALLTLEGSGMFGVVGISGRLFGALSAAGINVILITQGSSEHNITFAVSPAKADLAKRKVESAFTYELDAGLIRPIKVESRLSVIAIIGEQMRFRPGIAGRMFAALGRNGINCVAIAQGSSELNISVVIRKEDEKKALNALHDAFFLSDLRDVNLFIVGTGLIAEELLRQLAGQVDHLRESKRLNLRLIGLTNTRKMLFNEDGIDLGTWSDTLDEIGVEADLKGFAERLIQLNLTNSIFVDCSASEYVAALYEQLLAESVAISTPNKVATASAYSRYLGLKKLAADNSTVFAYETNVGAGLPLLGTLHDMSASGDSIRTIEGILSGSLSFIFNEFDGSKPFSEVVAEARIKGYTEPDPRVDLSGQDVARKLVILAREAGIPLEVSDVNIDTFLSEEAFAADTVEGFFDVLRDRDDALLGKQIGDLRQNNKRLIMLGELRGGKASVGLHEIDSSSPFWGMSGSDNMVVFTTDRYHERPLVVRGPGAGATVTAAGVFAEIITIGNLRSWE